MLKEFKEFAMKGNVMDLAIGVVIGAAFQKIVTSLVEDVIMPFISILTGKIDFSDMVLTVGNASIKYGNFITTIVNFLIISFSIFLVVKYINKLNKLKDLNDKFVSSIDKSGKFKKHKHSEESTTIVEPDTKVCPYCLSEIKYKATRCPHCTSEQPEIESLETQEHDSIKTEQ
ncbi:MAG: large conductance mechanosensitive channel protein MscL [Clostridia bacterium]